MKINKSFSNSFCSFSSCSSLKDIIIKNTEKIKILNINLNLITSNCQIYYINNENNLPFPLPWWGILWPGGLTIGKYLINNTNILKDKIILDIGSGCGFNSIISAKYGAKKVIANDIDIYAGLALELNIKDNLDVNPNIIEYCSENLLENNHNFNQYDIILCGDMLYDSTFSKQLLQKLTGHKMVIFGDPGRWCCPQNILDQCLLAEYPFDENDDDNNNIDGFKTGRVFRHL